MTIFKSYESLLNDFEKEMKRKDEEDGPDVDLDDDAYCPICYNNVKDT